MKPCCLLLLVLIHLACSPKISGTFEGEVEAWLSDSGGEYPVEYYRFKSENKFEYRVIFCMLTIRGSGRYRVKDDSVGIFKYKILNDPEVDDAWEISDTIIQKPFRILNNTTLLIDQVKFTRFRN